jgi:hypothetical protein
MGPPREAATDEAAAAPATKAREPADWAVARREPGRPARGRTAPAEAEERREREKEKVRDD